MKRNWLVLAASQKYLVLFFQYILFKYKNQQQSTKIHDSGAGKRQSVCSTNIYSTLRVSEKLDKLSIQFHNILFSPLAGLGLLRPEMQRPAHGCRQECLETETWNWTKICLDGECLKDKEPSLKMNVLCSWTIKRLSSYWPWHESHQILVRSWIKFVNLFESWIRYF